MTDWLFDGSIDFLIDGRIISAFTEIIIAEYCFTFFFLFQECSFNKFYDNTALKVSFQGNIQNYNVKACNRWYFTFNGNECSGPMTIDSVLYTDWNGGISNIHRHHSFEGYCENLARGTVRVELWTGKYSGYPLGNAFTGWNSVSRIMIEEVPPSQKCCYVYCLYN